MVGDDLLLILKWIIAVGKDNTNVTVAKSDSEVATRLICVAPFPPTGDDVVYLDSWNGECLNALVPSRQCDVDFYRVKLVRKTIEAMLT
jgi:hypothetical protein